MHSERDYWYIGTENNHLTIWGLLCFLLVAVFIGHLAITERGQRARGQPNQGNQREWRPLQK